MEGSKEEETDKKTKEKGKFYVADVTTPLRPARKLKGKGPRYLPLLLLLLLLVSLPRSSDNTAQFICSQPAC